MFKRYEIKIYPNKAQSKELGRLLDESRNAYNKILEIKIDAHKAGKNISRFEMEKVSKGMFNIPCNVRAGLIFRIFNAYKRFYRKNSNFPRFKSKRRFRSIPLKKYGSAGDYIFKGNKVRLWNPIKWVTYRGTVGKENIKGGIVLRRASGWYIQYIFEVAEKKPKKMLKNRIGIDMGLKSFLTDSKNVIVSAPKFFIASERRLARAQRKFSKSVNGSQRKFKKGIVVRRIYENISNQRKDWLHKLTRSYANKYDVVAVEDLNIKKMVQGGNMSKAIVDASWGMFISMLSYKLKMLGKLLIKVDPSYTSQECSACGKMVWKSLSIRTHICSCGFIGDRDYNAALNILKRAQHGLAARAVQ